MWIIQNIGHSFVCINKNHTAHNIRFTVRRFAPPGSVRLGRGRAAHREGSNKKSYNTRQLKDRTFYGGKRKPWKR
jgi:hypothetical protein